MTPAIEPFVKLYYHFIDERKPIKSDNCIFGNPYLYDITEYLLDELYNNVKSFKSDFLIDWTNISNTIKTLKPNDTIVFPIAFRENGVDGPNYIGLRAENGLDYFNKFYGSKKVYLLACVSDDTSVNVSLYNIYDDIINHFDLFKDYIKSC